MDAYSRAPSRDRLNPHSRGGTYSPGNTVVVCWPCNTAKGSLSLGRFANRLARAGDPRALRVAAFMQIRSLSFPS
jgi:hypothetical protein